MDLEIHTGDAAPPFLQRPSIFDPIEVTPIELISGSRGIQRWSTETPADSEDMLRFSELTGVRPMIETYPLEKVRRGLHAHDERQ
jgi:D-arabinose 1-dehydrogenase-like Zn-dependent alcohol dehydrogenase